MRAIIITGAPGAGKSSVLTALTDMLGAEGVEHVTVEVDDLARGWPWRYPPESFAGLAGFMSAQRTDLVLMTATLTSAEEVAGALDPIGCDMHLLVRLHARVDTLVRRVRERETIPWHGLEAMIGRTPALQVAIAALPGVDVTLDSEAATPRELAMAIKRASAVQGPTDGFWDGGPFLCGNPQVDNCGVTRSFLVSTRKQALKDGQSRTHRNVLRESAVIDADRSRKPCGFP